MHLWQQIGRGAAARVAAVEHLRTHMHSNRGQPREAPPRMISEPAATHRVPSIDAGAAVLATEGGYVVGRGRPWCCAHTRTRRHLNPANLLLTRFVRRARAAEQPTCARH